MELFSKQDPAVRQSLDGYIDDRWKQLYGLQKEWGERALRYLMVTNGGGAIATLSFLGASPMARGALGPKVSLFFFIFGIFLVGVSTAKTFHHTSSLFTAWKADVGRYRTDKITWEHLQSQDDTRAKEDIWDYLIPYASFGCFIAGCISGAISLFG